jgi:hypothetical protein
MVAMLKIAWAGRNLFGITSGYAWWRWSARAPPAGQGGRMVKKECGLVLLLLILHIALDLIPDL